MNLTLVRLKGKSLVPSATHFVHQTDDEDLDVPEEMEGILDDLFQAIQDKVSTLGFCPRLLKRAYSERFLGYCCSVGGGQRHWQNFRKTSPAPFWTSIGDRPQSFFNSLCRGHGDVRNANDRRANMAGGMFNLCRNGQEGADL